MQIGKKNPQLYFLDILLVMICFLLLIKYLLARTNYNDTTNSIEKVFLLFLAYCFITNLKSVDFFRGLATLRDYLAGWLVLGLTVRFFQAEKQIRKLFWILTMWGVLLSAILIHHILKQGNILLTVITKDIHLSWGSSNYLAAFFALLIPISFSVIFTKKLHKLARITLIVATLLMITALFLTGSRGGVVALAVGFLVLLCRFRSWKALFAFVFLLSFIGVVILLNPSSYIIWQGLVGYQASSSVLSRIELWKESAMIFKENPVWGVGIGNLQYFIKSYYVKLGSGFSIIRAHNLALELLAETGIIGFVIFGVLILKVLRIQVRNCSRIKGDFKNSLAWGIFSGTIAALTHSMVEPNILSYMFALVFWTIIGISIKQESLAGTQNRV